VASDAGRSVPRLPPLPWPPPPAAADAAAVFGQGGRVVVYN